MQQVRGGCAVQKLLFLIHDLGQGGAEKVLVNLVNNMDFSKFDITVMTLFDSGENRQFLSSHIKYKTWCKKMIPGNSHFLKLFNPEQLHKVIIKEKYDIEIAYLEGPCARVISGCKDKLTRLVAWIHIEQHEAETAAVGFRNVKEARQCYGQFDRIVCVSQTVKEVFYNALGVDVPYQVLYNTNENDKILKMAREKVTDISFSKSEFKIVGVGKLLKNKGFDRILRVTNRLLKEGYRLHLYILGEGTEKKTLLQYVSENHLEHNVTFLGYQLNPYKYVARCDLFVCSSFTEGFSTAATEALIVGTPICTVSVSGMQEMLGEHNEYGLITENNEDSLYQGIKKLMDSDELLDYYKSQAVIRRLKFSTKETVQAVENMFLSL